MFRYFGREGPLSGSISAVGNLTVASVAAVASGCGSGFGGLAAAAAATPPQSGNFFCTD